MSSLSALTVSPALVVSLVLSTLGFSIIKSGVTKGELMLDVPMITIFGAGVYHDMSLDETATMFAETVVNIWTNVAGGSELGNFVFMVAIITWFFAGVWFKFSRVLIDLKDVVIPG